MFSIPGSNFRYCCEQCLVFLRATFGIPASNVRHSWEQRPAFLGATSGIPGSNVRYSWEQCPVFLGATFGIPVSNAWYSYEQSSASSLMITLWAWPLELKGTLVCMRSSMQPPFHKHLCSCHQRWLSTIDKRRIFPPSNSM